MKLSVKQEQREKYTEMAEGCVRALGQEEELKERKYSPAEKREGILHLEGRRSWWQIYLGAHEHSAGGDSSLKRRSSVKISRSLDWCVSMICGCSAKVNGYGKELGTSKPSSTARCGTAYGWTHGKHIEAGSGLFIYCLDLVPLFHLIWTWELLQTLMFTSAWKNTAGSLLVSQHSTWRQCWWARWNSWFCCLSCKTGASDNLSNMSIQWTPQWMQSLTAYLTCDTCYLKPSPLKQSKRQETRSQSQKPETKARLPHQMLAKLWGFCCALCQSVDAWHYTQCERGWILHEAHRTGAAEGFKLEGKLINPAPAPSRADLKARSACLDPWASIDKMYKMYFMPK